MEEMWAVLAQFGFIAEDHNDRFLVVELGEFPGCGTLSLVHLSVGEHPQHGHTKATNTFNFYAGEGEVILGAEQKRVPFSRGTQVSVPAGELHGFSVREKGGFLVSQTSPVTNPVTGERDVFYPDEP